jgi:NAD(P)-dependent dehydrogenase (short-subunit alcohol dehydrogenase family)/CMP-N-acetylneuraminic acid synthetase
VRRLCSICARGGSKGLPGKNIGLLLGRPLIAHSIEQARASNLFERIAVSTDSAAIAAAARQGGADDIVDRPAELAKDTAAKVPAILHCLSEVEARHGVRYDTLVDLDVTAPTRLPEDIAGAVKLLEDTGVASVITGCTAYRSPYFDLVERQADGSVRVAKTPAREIVRRQDVPACFDMNASIYVWRAEALRRDPRVFYPDTRLYEMPAERSREVDSPFDFRVVEMMMAEMAGAGQAGRSASIPDKHSRFRLDGKVALVTGGAGILGRHFVAGLAEQGASVALLDLDGKVVSTFAEETAGRYGVKTLAIQCDIADGAALDDAIARIEGEFGAIDILHNNAATKGRDLAAFFAPLEEFALETWREIMHVNIDAMFLVAREVGRRMVARRRGSIIQTASIYGVVGPDNRIYEGSNYLGRAINTPPVYSASKAAVLGLTRHLATTWAPYNVRVNAITPGGVASGQNGVFQQKYAQRVPMGRMGEADEMVGALLFLASDAASYITGQNIVVDGGLTAW